MFSYILIFVFFFHFLQGVPTVEGEGIDYTLKIKEPVSPTVKTDRELLSEATENPFPKIDEELIPLSDSVSSHNKQENFENREEAYVSSGKKAKFFEGNSEDDVLGVVGRQWTNNIIDCLYNETVGACLMDALDRAAGKMETLEKHRTAKLRRSPIDFNAIANYLDGLGDRLGAKIDEEVKDFWAEDDHNLDKNFTITLSNNKEEAKDFEWVLKSSENGDISERKMKFNMDNMMSYMMVPALAMAGIMPWILPQIKMVGMVIMMMNQMAFSMGAMSLVRGLIFDSYPQEHVIYVNNGYKTQPKMPAHYKEHHLRRKGKREE